MPNVDDVADEITRRVKDALYVGVGLGMLWVQKAQVRRREMGLTFDQRVDEGRTVVRSLGQGLIALDDRAAALEARLLERLETGASEPAREAIAQVRALTTAVRAQVRQRLEPSPEA